MSSAGLCFDHVDVGHDGLVYVPLGRRQIWADWRYVASFPGWFATLHVPSLQPWNLTELESPFDHGCYARRFVTGHDCIGVACRALRLAGHDVSRWRGPVALFEYLNGLEGVRVEQATR